MQESNNSLAIEPGPNLEKKPPGHDFRHLYRTAWQEQTKPHVPPFQRLPDHALR